MALLCYNKGCGQRFDTEKNTQAFTCENSRGVGLGGENDRPLLKLLLPIFCLLLSDSCLHHPGFPIFHDVLKGWSCCKKRTTDFSEFLSIKGCTKGYHSNEKPPEPEEPKSKSKTSSEIIVQGPKSAEMMERERPSPDEPMKLLPVKVSGSLEQVLKKLDLSSKEQPTVQGHVGTGAVLPVNLGTTCKNSGCKAPQAWRQALYGNAWHLDSVRRQKKPLFVGCQKKCIVKVYQGEESNMETCVFHPGIPVFHEGMKYWSCCAIKTTDFNAFLEQKGCSRGKHTWLKKQDKKLVSCRQDWHQTSSQVVVTVYAKTPLPELSFVKANSTVLDIHIIFEGDKVFQAELDLWGVINVEKSSVTMVPSKVEITLQKDSPVTWARLEHPQSRSQAKQQLEADALESQEARAAPEESSSDDSLSWSDEDEEEWQEGGQGKTLSNPVSNGN